MKSRSYYFSCPCLEEKKFFFDLYKIYIRFLFNRIHIIYMNEKKNNYIYLLENETNSSFTSKEF